METNTHEHISENLYALRSQAGDDVRFLLVLIITGTFQYSMRGSEIVNEIFIL